MLKIRKNEMTPEAAAELENAKAIAQRSADLVEYVAMMADINIPSDDEGGENNE